MAASQKKEGGAFEKVNLSGKVETKNGGGVELAGGNFRCEFLSKLQLRCEFLSKFDRFRPKVTTKFTLESSAFSWGSG